MKLALKRRQIFEFCDQPWLPPFARDYFNDAIGFGHRFFSAYARATKPISAWAQSIGATQLLDLGSAGGEHINSLVLSAKKQGVVLPQFILSDLFPAEATYKRLQQQLGADAVGYRECPLSALDVPKDAPRYWTIFTTMHHFSPEQARTFLTHFAQQADGLCIGEYFHRNLYNILVTALGLQVYLLVPFVSRRPSVAKLVWGFLLPIGWLMYLFDGVVSVLRTYTIEEIIAMFPADMRDNFTIEYRSIWWGRLAPLKSQLIFITRKAGCKSGV